MAVLSGPIKALGAVSVLSDILSTSVPIVLGGIEFQDLEIPKEVRWGGTHATAIHQAPGDYRVVDRLGRRDAPIAWSGIFLQDVEDRAKALDDLRVSGQPVPLSWGQRLYTVVVTEFKCTDGGFAREYSVTCTVVRDEAALRGAQEPSLLDTVRTQVNRAVRVVSRVTSAVGLAGGVL